VKKKSLLAVAMISNAVLALTGQSPSEARLGAPVNSFSKKMSKNFLFKSQTTKGDSTYYIYSLIGDPKRQEQSPGFSGGVTLTVRDGKIAGESMLVVLGEKREVGKLFAVLLTLNGTYEAIGKPAPTAPKLQQAEIKAYNQAVEMALVGVPQHISYKGYPVKISVSRDKANNLLLALTSQAPPGEERATQPQ
jgi:hypothetical protein